MEELQQWWEVASIAQFCSLFRETFNLPEFDIDELEEGFIADGTPGGSVFLQVLLIRLLRGCYPRRGVNEENWSTFLYKIIAKRFAKEKGIPHPIAEGLTFSQLPLRTKVEIIYSLCLYRVDNEDVEHAMKSLDADCLRVQSLGSDDNGNVYWYFYGTRLYKEELSEKAKKLKEWTKEWEKEQSQTPEPVKRKRGRPRKQKPMKSDGESEESEGCDARKKGGEDSKSRWSVVCTTLTDWQQLAESFENSKSQCEKSLYRIITKDFLPVLKDMYEQKAKRIKKKMMEFAPRRASSRLEVKKLQKSEEDRLASIVAADEFEMYCQQRNCLNNHPEVRKERSRDRGRRLEERRQRIAAGSENGELQNNKGSNPQEDSQHPPHDAFTLLDTTHNRSDEFRNFIIKMRQVLVSVKLHKDAWPFLQPVDDSYAPGYYDIIANPIDLSAIETKLNKGLYENINQVDQDFSLMVDNCLHFNGENSVYSTMALSLRRHFRKAAAKCDLLNEYHAEVAAKIPRLEKEEDVVSTKSASPQKVPEKHKSLISENRVKRKKKKRPPGMKAIEALAEASAQALKKATVEPVEPLVSRSQVVFPPKSQAFPDLKIVTIQSHPASLLAKYASSVSQDSTGSDSFPYSSSLSPESSKDNEVDSMIQHDDNQESLHYKSADESSIDVHSVYQSSILNETDARDISDSLNTSHDSVASHMSNSSAEEDSHVFAQITNNADVSHSAEVDQVPDGQQNLSTDIQNKHLEPPEGNPSDTVTKMPPFQRTSRGSTNCQAGSAHVVHVSAVENPSSPSCSRSHQESFNNRANEATPPRVPNSPCTQQTIDPTFSPSGFGLLSTVDASVLGLQCSKNLFLRNNPSVNNQRLDNLLSSLSPNATHGGSSTQSPEKALHDALLGVEFVSDIAKTINELDKLKTANSPHSPVFTSSGSPPLIPSGPNFHVPNLSSVSPEPKLTETKDSGSAVTNNDQSAFNSLQLTKTFGPAVYPVSPDSTDMSDKAVSSGINPSADLSGSSSPSDHVESSNKSPQHSLASQLTAQFFPLTLPLPMNTQADMTSQSSHIPLQLPPSFPHPFMSDVSGKNLNPALVPSTVPFIMNTATNPLQLSIPIGNTSSSSSSPVALVSSPQMFTTVPVSVTMATTDSSGTTHSPPLGNAHGNSSSSPKQVPKNQSSDSSSNGQDLVNHNSIKKSSNMQDSRNRSISSMSESPSAVSGYPHQSDLQKESSTVQNQSVSHISSNQHTVYTTSSSTNASFNIPRPPHCVPPAYNVQANKTQSQDWNLQNFTDCTPVGSRVGSESARHSVIMAAHQHVKTSVSSPVFSSAISTNSDNIRLCGPSIITTAGKDSVIPTGSFAQTMPSFVAAQPPQQNVIVNYIPPDLNSYSVNSNHVPVNNMQYNIVPNIQSVAYSNMKDNRPDKNFAVVSNGNSAQYAAVSAVKNSSVSAFGTNNVPASVTNNFPNSISTKTSTASQGNRPASKSVSKQPNKKGPVHNTTSVQKHEVAAHTYFISGAQEKFPQVLSNVSGLQPTYFSMPHLVLPPQTSVHGILPSQLLTPHSNQMYQPNQRFVMGETETSKANENRQSVFANRNVQFLAAPSASTTK